MASHVREFEFQRNPKHNDPIPSKRWDQLKANPHYNSFKQWVTEKIYADNGSLLKNVTATIFAGNSSSYKESLAKEIWDNNSEEVREGYVEEFGETKNIFPVDAHTYGSTDITLRT